MGYTSKRKAGGNAREAANKSVMGYPARQHQDMVGNYGQGGKGDVGVIIPYGRAVKVPKPPVGAGKGFKGW